MHFAILNAEAAKWEMEGFKIGDLIRYPYRTRFIEDILRSAEDVGMDCEILDDLFAGNHWISEQHSAFSAKKIHEAET